MVLLLPLLMAYALIGADLHEYLGVAMFVLFIGHHILNFQWLKGLFRGRYTPVRIFSTAVNVLLLFTMLGSMVSGIMLSSYVFTFLRIRMGMGFARTVHMLSAYWGFCLMSVHLGIHWSRFMGMAKKLTGAKPSAVRRIILRAVAAVIAAYGIYAFIRRGIGGYMFLRTLFVFFDTTQSRALFLLDYSAIMGLFAAIGHYIILIPN